MPRGGVTKQNATATYRVEFDPISASSIISSTDFPVGEGLLLSLISCLGGRRICSRSLYQEGLVLRQFLSGSGERDLLLLLLLLRLNTEYNLVDE